MKVTRRDLLFWGAGAAAGLIVTPVPWKILDDTSIWSQNWPWIPQAARGPVEVKQSACTLCPQGCGLRVRMAAGWPVGVAGVSSHPVSRGALCPLAFGAHQLNWHPLRLKSVLHRGTASSWPNAQAALAKAQKEGPVVIIDGYPGRAASSVMEAFAEKKRGEYRVVFSPETKSLLPYESWSKVPASALGYDLENAHTIVSFGAPLLDGWGTPGRFTRLWAERAADRTDPELRLIQVEATLSRTASRAWQWIPIRDGSEAALAAGLARVLLENQLVQTRGPLPALSLADAAGQTGLTEDAIRDLARTMIAQRPVVAVANRENPAVAALNVVLGAVGTAGGIVRKTKTARPYSSAETALPSARAVVIDASVPWDYVPQTDAEVFRFAAWDGGGSKADWLLPAPGFLEELKDVPTPPASATESYAIAPSLTKSLHETHGAAQFLASIDSALPTHEQIIHARCQNLFRLREGNLYAQEITPLAKIESAQKLEDQLSKGAVWMGTPSKSGMIRCERKEWPAFTAAIPAETWSESWATPVLPPLAPKLYQESSLREPPTRRTA